MKTNLAHLYHRITSPSPDKRAEAAVVYAAMKLYNVPRECPATFADDLAKLMSACKALDTLRRK